MCWWPRKPWKNHLSQELTTWLKTAVPLLYHPVLIYITKQDFIWINKHTCQIFFKKKKKKKSKPRLHMATVPHKLYSNSNYFPFFQSSTNITPILGITTDVEMWDKVQWLHKSRDMRCAMYIQEHPRWSFPNICFWTASQLWRNLYYIQGYYFIWQLSPVTSCLVILLIKLWRVVEVLDVTHACELTENIFSTFLKYGK
jgi:hypothetical protein